MSLKQTLSSGQKPVESDSNTRTKSLSAIFYFEQVFIFCILIDKNVLERFLLIMCKEHTLTRSTNVISRNHYVLVEEEKAGKCPTVLADMNLAFYQLLALIAQWIALHTSLFMFMISNLIEPRMGKLILNHLIVQSSAMDFREVIFSN